MNDENAEATPLLSDKWYNFLKWFVTLALPGLGTLYFTVAKIWELQYAEQVVGTTSAIAVFLGLLLRLSDRSYKASDAKFDGKLVINTDDPEKDVYNFVIKVPLEDLAHNQAVTLKVQK